MWTTIVKDFRQFFFGWTGLAIYLLFYLILGFVIWINPDTSVLDNGYADLSVFFDLSPMIFVFFLPAIAMSSFSEEYRVGTIQLLRSKPIRDRSLVLAKFFGLLLLCVVMLVPLLIYYYSIHQLALPVGNIDSGATTGSYVGLFLLMCSFVAIGLFSSSISSSQLGAFAIGLVLCFFITYGFGLVSNLPLFSGRSQIFIESLGMDYHYKEMGKGLFRLDDLLYMLSIQLFFLYLTYVVIKNHDL